MAEQNIEQAGERTHPDYLAGKFPVEVWDEMHGCCWVTSRRVRSLVTHSSKQISYGPSRAGKYGETEDILLGGEKVGFRFFTYE